MPKHNFINEYFIVSNQENFQTNSSTHNINTRNKHHFHRPSATLFSFQKSTLYAGIKIFNILTRSLTILKNEKAKFKIALEVLKYTFLLLCREFFMCKDDL
jgi:hypothetical protein